MRRPRRPGTLGFLALLLALAWPGGVLAQSTDATDPRDANEPPAPAVPLALAGLEQPPLEGTTWRVTHYPARDGPAADLRPVGPEIAPWLTMRGGRLRGSTGCTALGGRYTRLGPLLDYRVDADPADGSRCTEQEAMASSGMVRGLVAAARHEIVPAGAEDGPELILRDRGGQAALRLTPDDVAPLEGAEWRLATYTTEGTTVAADPAQPGLLTFDRERGNAVRRSSFGSLVGSTGCNGIVAGYARRASVLSLGELETTGAPCLPTLADQESVVVAVLDSTSLRVGLPPDRLVLVSDDTGDRLEYVSTIPLEGTTWVLARLRGSPAGTEPVTLWLEDGLVSGEGPCGPYRGSYATDGVFISFGQLVGPESATCAERARQADLLKALRNAVVLDRPNGRLRLLDIAGRTLARFASPGGP